MITKRLGILTLTLLAGLSTVFLLPKQLMYQPLGVNKDLPEYVGEWLGSDLKVSDLERETLGPETEFSRKSYTNGRGDEIMVSIVLAGQDMNTSIHRPERCLPAQGWSIVDKRSVAVAVPAQPALHATRLHNLRNIAKAGENPLPLYNLNYYWFVGYTNVTGSHFERTWIDVSDRLLHGYNQRWAYVTIAATVTKGRQKFGRDEKETDALIEGFIKQLVPLIHQSGSKTS